MAFRDCTSLQSIKFPDSVTSIGTNAFSDCTSLASVTFGNGMTSTGLNAFRDCTSLRTVVFSPSITAIDSYSFYNTKITSIEIPETITSIGTRAFANCTFLNSVTIYNANCTFGGLESGNGPFDGTTQDLVFYGHKGSTSETFADSKGYRFVSIDPCDHTSTHEVVITQPTCTEKGLSSLVCDDCGFVVSQFEIKKTDHDWVLVESEDQTLTDGHIYTLYACVNDGCYEENIVIEHKEYLEGYYEYSNSATCTAPGIEKYTCLVEGCDAVKRSIAQRAEHTVEQYSVYKAPTCTEKGSKTGVCTQCEQEVTVEIPANGHDNVYIDEFDNTLDDGHTYVIYECAVCHEQSLKATHVDWLEENYSSRVISEAHCVINGRRIDTCSICGLTRNVVLEANGEHVWYETTRTEPNCTAVGKIYYACENCDFTKSENVDALGHEYEFQEESSLVPTCTAGGYNIYKCSRCNYVDNVVISALGHTVDELNYAVVNEPTCTEDGSAMSICMVCDEVLDIVLTSLDHDFEAIEEELPDKPGHVLSTPTCTRCGYIDINKTGTVHKEWLEGYYTHNVVISGTCIIAEVSRDTCTLCGTAKTNTLQAKGHAYRFDHMENNGNLVYQCGVCSNEETRTPQLVAAEFPLYINQSPSDSILGYRFEINFDGVINAKDYSLINKAVLKSKAYQ